MFRSCKHADEPSKDGLKTSLRFLRRQFGQRRLVANDVPQFRDEIDEEQSVRTPPLTICSLPFAQIFLVLAEEPPDKALKRTGQGGVRNIPLVLVGFARREQAAWPHERFMKLIDDCGFSDPGVSRDQHQFGSATANDAVEGGQQSVNFAVPPIQLLWDDEAIRGIVCAKSEVIDPPVGLPLG